MMLEHTGRRLTADERAMWRRALHQNAEVTLFVGEQTDDAIETADYFHEQIEYIETIDDARLLEGCIDGLIEDNETWSRAGAPATEAV